MFPTAGAEYDFAGRALGERIGFAIGWLVIAATIISASAVALGFAAYFRTFLPAPPIAVAGSSLLYVLVAVACVSLLGWEGTSANEAPFAAAIGVAFGGAAAVVVSLTALTATANTVLIEILAASRILYGMARNARPPAYSAGFMPAVGPPGSPWSSSQWSRPY